MNVVNKYRFLLNNNSDYTDITIPIVTCSYPEDNSELIEKDFVDIEVDKAINPIIDYETVRLEPIGSGYNTINHIQYSITFKNGGKLSDLGFTQNDIYYRKNGFTKSFLQLDFYDSDILVSQNYLYTATLFCRVASDYLIKENGTTKLKSVNDINLTFKIDNPIYFPDGISEGFYLYNYKDEIPKDIYMRATFNNAKTGKSTKLTCVSSVNGIDNLSSKLHTVYSLRNDGLGYRYMINDSQGNVIDNNGDIKVNLFEVNLT